MPISVVASFKKIKALITTHSQLATTLRNSMKLVSIFLVLLFHALNFLHNVLSLHVVSSYFFNGLWFYNVQVVSEDGKKVRRQHPLTEPDMEELQVRFFFFLNKYCSISSYSSFLRTLYVNVMFAFVFIQSHRILHEKFVSYHELYYILEIEYGIVLTFWFQILVFFSLA